MTLIEWLTDPAILASLATLTFLEIVLGIDNLVFISIVTEKLPEKERVKARSVGLSMALIFRILLLTTITWIAKMTEPVFSIGDFGMSWRDMILFAGGAFLIWKATLEIHTEVEGGDEHDITGPAKKNLAMVMVQIMILDIIFSIDSIITAVGIADNLPVMITAVVIAVGVMFFAAAPVGRFIAAHPSIKMLALAFLVMVGMVLVADGLHFHIDRGFVYAAIAFSLFNESLNIVARKRREKKRGAPAPDPMADL